MKSILDKLKEDPKSVNKLDMEDGSVVTVKGGMKKGGKVLKLELQWDKSFVEDNVNIHVQAGMNNISLVSPEKSDGVYVNFSATKRF
jgi:hypothetical protein